jgi:hypothetical protein
VLILRTIEKQNLSELVRVTGITVCISARKLDILNTVFMNSLRLLN